MGRKKQPSVAAVALVICVSFLMAGIFSAAAYADFSATPAEIKIENVLNRGYAAAELTITTTDAEPEIIALRASGPLKDWLTFEPDKVAITRDLPARIKVVAKPDAQAVGRYSGFITLAIESPGLITPAVINNMEGLPISILVTEDAIEEFSIERIISESTEEGSLFRVGVKVQNKGNVQTHVHAAVNITPSKNMGVVLGSDSTEVEMLPGGTVQALLEPKVFLPEGEYIAAIAVFSHGYHLEPHKMVHFLSQRTAKFRVHKKGRASKGWQDKGY